ncbi:alpha/beta fold hydrolase [Halobaculum sp. MBLA0147]|uniref:alpha/beta fold hydrolase n=1 Tax=Halobaculum sp. MBLA0147 TaxID=3079934 RepID=UPI003525084E
MPRTTLNGAEIYYETRGDPSDPSILALHGGPGIGDGRKPLGAFETLADDYHLVVPDHRGCGRSELAPPYTNEQFAADVAALREALSLGEVVLIGGSYGGFVTQQYAIDHPEHLRAVVFRDTAATPEYDRAARETARDRLPEVRERDLDVPHITAAELDRVMDGEVPSDEEFERLYHGMAPLYAASLDEFDATATAEQIESLHFHHETHNHVFSEVFPEMDYTDALPDVEVPALVTVGRHDWITPVAASEELAELLPNARLRIFEESGHNPHLDQADAWLAETRAFLNAVGHR